jgi:NhaA family Na+:H+ antiporter
MERRAQPDGLSRAARGAPRRPWSHSGRTVPRILVRPIQQFMRQEASGGIVLLAATIAALVWANVDFGGYTEFWETEFTVVLGEFSITEDLRHVVNDGLMTIFFLVIGLEVKRELTVGELSERKAAMLPAAAALGGMIFPALIYLAITQGDASEGWGIPIATDVAFALAALAALGRLVPYTLVAFVLGVAVVDDIGAIAVIAIFYTDDLNFFWLLAAVVGLLLMVLLNRLHVRYLPVYFIVGFGVWFCTFESGVHATIAGVAIGLITPVHPFQNAEAAGEEATRVAELAPDDPDDEEQNASYWRQIAEISREAISPLDRVEHALHQWSSFVVLPIFALANAGILLTSDTLSAAAESPVAPAVAFGLVFGKITGLTVGAFAAVTAGLARLPRGVTWAHIIGAGAIAGIGFTVSLFISELAFDDPELANASRIGILFGSVIAAVVGIATLAIVGRIKRARSLEQSAGRDPIPLDAGS